MRTILGSGDGDAYYIDKRRKRDGEPIDIDQVLHLENCGDDGDEYDYSPITARTPVMVVLEMLSHHFWAHY